MLEESLFLVSNCIQHELVENKPHGCDDYESTCTSDESRGAQIELFTSITQNPGSNVHGACSERSRAIRWYQHNTRGGAELTTHCNTVRGQVGSAKEKRS